MRAPPKKATPKVMPKTQHNASFRDLPTAVCITIKQSGPGDIKAIKWTAAIVKRVESIGNP